MTELWTNNICLSPHPAQAVAKIDLAILLLVEKPVHEHALNYTNMLPKYAFGAALRFIYCYLSLPKIQTRIYGKAVYTDQTENMAE